MPHKWVELDRKQGKEYEGRIVRMKPLKAPGNVTGSRRSQFDNKTIKVILNYAPGKDGIMWRATPGTPRFAMLKLLTI